MKDIHGDFKYGLKELMQLKTYNFTYKKNNPYLIDPTISQSGVIAQDVEKDTGEIRKDRREIRGYTREIRQDRRELYKVKESGDAAAANEARQAIRRDVRDRRQDVRDLRQDKRDQREDVRER